MMMVVTLFSCRACLKLAVVWDLLSVHPLEDFCTQFSVGYLITSVHV